MKILFVSSEVAPFAKSGGLGDVSAALPRELAAQGHDVRVVMPLYPRVHAHGTFTPIKRDVDVDLGRHRVRMGLYASTMPGTQIPVYGIQNHHLFDRPSLYGSADDEHVRFALLCWGALKTAQHTGFAPDIIHINDWQTGLIPLLLKTRFAWDQLFANTKTVLTLHNLGHQGTFPAHILPDTGLGDSAHLFHNDELREGRLSYLLTGILYADAITTVSPTYAREIQTPDQGVRLDPFLRSRRDVLSGILNGIDEDEWNPEKDPHIPGHFTSKNLAGKAINKEALMTGIRQAYRPEVPVVGLVSRLVWQKGLDLAVEVLPQLLRRHRFQLVVLGKGEPKYEEFFRLLQRAFPHKVHYDGAFNERKAHLIEAGADMFLMPSRYEPCGLNQMYSLRYGTVPIVHKTGGLADTVWQYDEGTGRGTGFVFEHFDANGLSWAMRQAFSVWGSGEGAYRRRWEGIMRNGMDLPFGWRHRIGRYLEIYSQLTGIPVVLPVIASATKTDGETP